jgi:hypothetical protein
LPELVGPTDGVVGAECFRRQSCEQFAQLHLGTKGT